MVTQKNENMKILTLQIKQKFFNEIMAGTKKIEYRDISFLNCKKYCKMAEDGSFIPTKKKPKYKGFYIMNTEGQRVELPYIEDEVKEGNVALYEPKHYDAIRFYVGYAKDRDTALIKVKKTELEPQLVEETGEWIGFDLKDLAEENIYWLNMVACFELGEVIEKRVKVR